MHHWKLIFACLVPSLDATASLLSLVELAERSGERVKLPVDEGEARTACRFELPNLSIQLLEVRIARAAALPPVIHVSGY